MSNPATDCPVWKRYLEVVTEAGGQANYLPAKSALYKRLLEGKQPLVLPPPIACSYACYTIVESDKAMAPLDGPFPLEAQLGGTKMDAVLIEQTPWCVVERISALELIVSQPGWHELGFRWRYWHHPMRADESQACLIAHYAPGAGRITTSSQLDLECRHHAEHWRAYIEIAISDMSDEVKLTAIDPGIEDQTDPLRYRMRRSAAHIRLAEAQKEAQTREGKGLPAVPTSAEVDSYAVRYRESLLAGTFEERDGWLFVDGWALQRIAPSAIGPEHYLPGAPVPATAVQEA
ncbi:hypothetical protein HKW90_01890 [Pseudomonas aeruginosa]|nr:hypothetical protein [Pseudomonas aeruginosa]